MIEPTVLAAKVKAVNLANDYATRVVYPKLSEFFRPYVGQAIDKADGTLLKKIADKMPELKDPSIHYVYRSSSNWSLCWTVKTCVCTPAGDGRGQHAYYHEVSVYIGEMKGGVLTKIMDPPTGYRADYTAEYVERMRTAYQDAKREADVFRSAIGPFGEYDV